MITKDLDTCLIEVVRGSQNSVLMTCFIITPLLAIEWCFKLIRSVLLKKIILNEFAHDISRYLQRYNNLKYKYDVY